MVSLHPIVDKGLQKGDPNFQGGTLKCLCSSNPVEIKLKGNVLHQHLCGCSQCWRPKGALFSQVAVIPDGNVEVTKNKDKLEIVDKNATILRYACKDCGAHLYGPIEKDHAFKGLSFVHTDLSDDKGWQEPQFAAFVSSLTEQGYPPEKMGEVREKIKELGIEPYDALSPPLMDALANFEAEKSGNKRKL
ncbi:S-glutathione synthase [Exophiala viscosa]|uniref:S-glutathione synthase n=1 Tax=Exophiala viscosa TaxID=2486360 RepID=UPI002193920D|nr:S-glutathione synthase [Exophiala viscosa]